MISKLATSTQIGRLVKALSAELTESRSEPLPLALSSLSSLSEISTLFFRLDMVLLAGQLPE